MTFSHFLFLTLLSFVLSFDESSCVLVARRIGGKPVDFFYRGWDEYVAGFGTNMEGEEYFCGLANLHLWSKSKTTTFKFVHEYYGTLFTSYYESFYVDDESDFFSLHVSGHYGDGADCFQPHNGYKFSTYDNENDVRTYGSCATGYRGAWWYNSCHACNLFGWNCNGYHSSYANCIDIGYSSWGEHHYSSKFVEMYLCNYVQIGFELCKNESNPSHIVCNEGNMQGEESSFANGCFKESTTQCSTVLNGIISDEITVNNNWYACFNISTNDVSTIVNEFDKTCKDRFHPDSELLKIQSYDDIEHVKMMMDQRIIGNNPSGRILVGVYNPSFYYNWKYMKDDSTFTVFDGMQFNVIENIDYRFVFADYPYTTFENFQITSWESLKRPNGDKNCMSIICSFQLPICFGKKYNEIQCNSRGNCTFEDTCECEHPYFGGECEYFNCSGIPVYDNKVCSSHGTCTNPNVCLCDSTRLGNNCQYPWCYSFNVFYGSVEHILFEDDFETKNYTKWESYSLDQNIFISSAICGSDEGNSVSFTSPNERREFTSLLIEPFTFDYEFQLSFWFVIGDLGFEGCDPGLDSSHNVDVFVLQESGNMQISSLSFDKNTASYYSFTFETTENFQISFQQGSNNGGGKNVWSLDSTSLKIITSTCHSYGTCVDTDLCECDFGYSGKSCKYEISSCSGVYSNNSKVCNSHGECVNTNCICNDGCSSNDCELFSCFGKLNNDSDTCSSFGTCVDIDQCVCEEGYLGDQCGSFGCFGIDNNDVEVCSSHGNCESANFCGCEENYFGDPCDNWKCYGINQTDSHVCSKNGTCLSHNTCDCFSGYFGDECENWYCFSIANTEISACSGNGSCIKHDLCTCNHEYEGEQCENWRCFDILMNDVNSCNGNGNCVSPQNCNCYNAHFGDECEFWTCNGINYTDKNVCSGGNGTCVAAETCVCNIGYAGKYCTDWLCDGILMSSTEVCSGMGICHDYNSCICESNYSGNNCEEWNCFDISRNDKNTCSLHGECISFNECNCTVGYSSHDCSSWKCFGVNSTNNDTCSSKGICSSSNSCTCVENYYGNECEKWDCFSIEKSNNSTCSSHGSCENPNICQCDDDYSNENCSMYSCFGIPLTEKDDNIVCNSNGLCVDYNSCECFLGYDGEDCSSVECFGKYLNEACSGNGVCYLPDLCICDFGYSGLECKDYYCFGISHSAPNVCSENGVCAQPDKCECIDMYDGKIHENCTKKIEVVSAETVIEKNNSDALDKGDNSSNNGGICNLSLILLIISIISHII